MIRLSIKCTRDYADQLTTSLTIPSRIQKLMITSWANVLWFIPGSILHVRARELQIIYVSVHVQTKVISLYVLQSKAWTLLSCFWTAQIDRVLPLPLPLHQLPLFHLLLPHTTPPSFEPQLYPTTVRQIRRPGNGCTTGSLILIIF